jgi:hypothetical protein
VAKCHWKSGRGPGAKKHNGEQKIIDYSYYFFGSLNNDTFELSEGIHFYNFSCKVPANASASYDGTYGSIKYKVEVVLDALAMRDIKQVKSFTVLRIENLNDYPWLRYKLEREEEHSVGVACCESLPLVMSMKLPKVGYALGEKIVVTLEASNQGPSKYSASMLALERLEVCNSQMPLPDTLRTKKVIKFVNSRGVEPFEKLIFEECIQIPEEMQVSIEMNCNIFQISYQIVFTIQSGRRSKVELVAPIVICNIPYSDPETEILQTCDEQSTPVEVLEPKLPFTI